MSSQKYQNRDWPPIQGMTPQQAAEYRTYFVMPDLIRHPVFLFLDSGQRTTFVRVRRNDKTAASCGELTPKGDEKSEESADIFLDILQKWN